MPDYKFTIGEYSTKLPPPKKILTGQRFERLLVIGCAGRVKGRIAWHCLCACGNGITVTASHLINNHTRSCGCLLREMRPSIRLTHGETIHRNISPEYAAYQAAKARCEQPSADSYKTHGGRGIKFLFTSFEELLAEVGRRPSPKHSLDRYPNNETGHYEKGNVRWATKKEQARNTRRNHLVTFNDKTQCLIEWCEELGRSWHTVKSRIYHGWCDVCAISLDSRQTCTHKTISP